MLLLNTGTVNMYVGCQGEYIIDFSWVSIAAACLVTAWRMIQEVETPSDIPCIYIEVLPSRDGSNGEPRGRASPENV